MIFGRKKDGGQTPDSDSGPSQEQVIEALRQVNDPELKRSLVDLGMVRDVRVSGGTVSFEVELTTPACPLKSVIETDCRNAVEVLPGVERVEVSFSSRVPAGRPRQQQTLPGVKHVIAVASGKGGVGKSTVAINLAAALAATGARTGLLDADIYGPSLPLMLGMDDPPLVQDVADPETGQTARKIVPLEKFDMKVMSLGFLAPGDKAVIWRGPLVASAVRQMLMDTMWGDLDYLVVDLPPGTGDAPMSLAQLVPLSGVVIVMTAQDVALTIATKSLRMFQSAGMDVPVLGIVENMSMFVCPHCGGESEIFGSRGAGETAAGKLGVRFLGRVPLDPRIVTDSDSGVPTYVADPESSAGVSYAHIAEQVAAEVSVQALTPSPPRSEPVEFIG